MHELNSIVYQLNKKLIQLNLGEISHGT
ncbi:hypothetical protein H1P_1570014 [Hyella patelloides LEGE 07179]|uniref:Uncharacterized protein n=1 Tax=Hyella patelloides LEGE 07179 TaxID=945734 RepID=A0A563VMH3_9CYAN|nr:hypothetical protein H1P_1570014 [Hyella patelloides LEGE 07179]